MRAIVFDRFGGTEVLHEVDLPAPEPGPGQVRVRVRAAGVNPLDGKIRSGAMQAMRPTVFPAIPGFELAGEVDAVGDGVVDLRVGDEVFGFADSGSYAEHALATAVVARPEGLSAADAVALPVAGETALRVLDLLDVADGETLLVHGAGGAVGTVAVQLAVARGARVIGTAGAANQEHVVSLGATATTYGTGLVERVRSLAPKGVDAVFDVAGKGALEDSIALRGGTDRIVTIADPAARGLGVTFSASTGEHSSATLAALAAQAVGGALVSPVTTYALADAAKAQDAADAGHGRGKLVLLVD